MYESWFAASLNPYTIVVFVIISAMYIVDDVVPGSADWVVVHGLVMLCKDKAAEKDDDAVSVVSKADPLPLSLVQA